MKTRKIYLQKLNIKKNVRKKGALITGRGGRAVLFAMFQIQVETDGKTKA